MTDRYIQINVESFEREFGWGKFSDKSKCHIAIDYLEQQSKEERYRIHSEVILKSTTPATVCHSSEIRHWRAQDF